MKTGRLFHFFDDERLFEQLRRAGNKAEEICDLIGCKRFTRLLMKLPGNRLAAITRGKNDTFVRIATKRDKELGTRLYF